MWLRSIFVLTLFALLVQLHAEGTDSADLQAVKTTKVVDAASKVSTSSEDLKGGNLPNRQLNDLPKGLFGKEETTTAAPAYDEDNSTDFTSSSSEKTTPFTIPETTTTVPTTTVPANASSDIQNSGILAVSYQFAADEYSKILEAFASTFAIRARRFNKDGTSGKDVCSELEYISKIKAKGDAVFVIMKSETVKACGDPKWDNDAMWIVEEETVQQNKAQYKVRLMNDETAVTHKNVTSYLAVVEHINKKHNPIQVAEIPQTYVGATLNDPNRFYWAIIALLLIMLVGMIGIICAMMQNNHKQEQAKLEAESAAKKKVDESGKAASNQASKKEKPKTFENIENRKLNVVSSTDEDKTRSTASNMSVQSADHSKESEKLLPSNKSTK